MSVAITWLLRLSAWGLLVTVATCIVIAPRRTVLNGRLRQAHMRLESEAATAAVSRLTGLDRLFDPKRYEFQVSSRPGHGLPTWLGVSDRDVADYRDRTTWIWLTENGDCLLPPLADPLRTGYDWNSIPDEIVLRGRGDRRLIGAICILGGRSGRTEWSVWVHRDDRWVCALRFQSTTSVGKFELNQDLRKGATVALELASPTVRWTWNSDREAFDVPASLPAPLLALEPLPDQVSAGVSSVK